MSEPRQFWIQDRSDWYIGRWLKLFVSKDPLPIDLEKEEFGKTLHVIEYSAYAELQEKLKVAEEALEKLSCYYEEKPFFTKLAKEVLRKIRGE